MKLVLLSFIAFFIASCGQSFNTDGGSVQDSQFNAVTCSCTQNYDPVCSYSNGRYVTYTNACLAQCAGVDFSYGVCTQSSTNSGCNINSGQVCGRPKLNCNAGEVCTDTLPSARLYANECELIRDDADLVNASNCN